MAKKDKPEIQMIDRVHRVVEEAPKTGAVLVPSLASLDLRREI